MNSLFTVVIKYYSQVPLRNDHKKSRMSKLNGQYGIVDESDSNRTIISLKLTPAAAEKIKQFIEKRGIGGKGASINFSAQDDVITEVM